MKRSAIYIVTAVLAGLFGLFLTYGHLTSSDFPRGLRAGGSCGPGHWPNLDSLNINRNWGGPGSIFPSLYDYLDTCNHWGIQPMLRLWTPAMQDEWILYHSYGQYQHYEAEMTYDFASLSPFDRFYFFMHSDTSANWNAPVRGFKDVNFPGQGEASWKCAVAEDDSGVMLLGPGETLRNEHWLTNYAEQRNQVSGSLPLPVKAIFKVSAAAQNLADNDTICRLSIFYDPGNSSQDSIPLHNDSLMVDSFLTKASFQDTLYNQWKRFEFDYTTPPQAFNVVYRIIWMDRCDFWVDWIEFMDRDRGYYLFYTDVNNNYIYRDSVLDTIYQQCSPVEAYIPGLLAGWEQSNEPYRGTYRAHGVINEFLRQRTTKRPAALFCTGK